ncbi:hypothetical protein [Franconibacter daqui]|uniref:hypothetical protein n=1 Tax=Franconibacter daqui TaxID=2047724 RepID=UPI002DBE969B|nr:hypothetical protein [Franconibacter daqui]MEB5923464.1 hypothetical protein [Franconibacter daqui]
MRAAGVAAFGSSGKPGAKAKRAVRHIHPFYFIRDIREKALWENKDALPVKTPFVIPDHALKNK